MPEDNDMKEGLKLLKALKAAGQTDTVRIEFSGSGDDGGIDGVEGLDRGQPLYQQVEDWAGEFADNMPCDWVNNDGGFGWIELDVEKQTIRYSVDANEM